jgi:hypothetical protein
MAKQPQKKPEDMTNEELRDHWRRFTNRAAVINKRSPWISLGVAVVGCLAAGVMALTGVPFALAAVAGSIGAGSITLATLSMVRDRYTDKAFWVNQENEERLIVAKAQHRQAAEKAARALREEFEGALQAMSEGRGTDKEVKVGRALRLRPKSMFGTLAS